MFRVVRDHSLKAQACKYINVINGNNAVRQISTANQTFPDSADVVIIGGGIAGCNTLYQLSKRGVNAVLLERAKLTSGTTWHTAGLVWSLRPSDLEVQLLTDSKNVYSGLEAETGQNSGWLNNGGLFISHSQVRTDEYLRLHTLGKALNVPSFMLDPTEAAKLMPILDPNAFEAALYSPEDGTIDPSMSCNALVKFAKGKGGKVFEDCAAFHIQTDLNMLGNKEVKGVTTTQGHIKTKCVVNCSGAWGPNVVRLAGLPALPLVPFKHAYVLSESVPEVRGAPNVRDHDFNLYLKMQGETVAIGGYEPNPHMLDEVPDNFEFQLYELDWDIFGVHIDSATKLCPKLEKVGIKSTVCGPESFTPDHKPLLGEDTKIFGLYHNCAYNSAGMMFSAGCAIQMAEWIVNGRPHLPMFTFDVRRFTPAQLSRAHWVRERSHEAYVRNYYAVFSNDEPLAGRDVSLDALHHTLVQDGAVMQSRAGWERPAFFLQNEIVDVPRYDWGGHNDYPRNTNLRYEEVLSGDYTYGFSKHHDLIGEEALACRNSAALFNMSYYGKFYLTGPEAQRTAELAFTADLKKEDGRVVYTCALNEKGGVEADVTVSILDGGSGHLHGPIFKGRGYYIVTSGFNSNHTYAHLRRVINLYKLRADITDVTKQICILSIQGPKSQRILQKYTDTGLTNDAFPVNSHRTIQVSSAPHHDQHAYTCRALRVGWAGELGWELHVAAAHASGLYRGLRQTHGLHNAGWRALTSLSAEKGYHLWNADLRADDSPVEANLGFTCRRNADYIGHKAVDRARVVGVTKKYAYFTLDDHVALYGHEAIYRNGKVVGYLRRGDYAYYLNRPIGIGYVHNQTPGDLVNKQYLKDGQYEIEVRGKKYKANLHLRSPFDTKGLRILGNYEDTNTDENTHEPHAGQNERAGGCE